MSPPGNLDDLSPAELKALIARLLDEVAEQQRVIAEQREEIARLKGLNGRPRIKTSKPSGMEEASLPKRTGKRRRGHSNQARVAVEDQVITAAVSAGSRFKGYESYVVQELEIRPRVIRYRRERWLTPDGRTVVAPLPPGISGHFGPTLRRFVLAQYHQGQVTVPRLVAQLRDFGLAVSKRQVVRLLTAKQDRVLDEAREVMRAGLSSAAWITVDDTSARHKAKNGFCTHIGNDRFAWFGTTGFKSCRNFLELLRAGHEDYVIKAELLIALDRPEIPLHTNSAENAIRCQVTKRKISGGTRSDLGRNCRDAFLGLAKTCAKLGVAFWDYLGARLGCTEPSSVPDLPQLVSAPLPHTRRAYLRACNRFLGWCEQRGLTLAAIRMLFNWLVTGQIVPTNPAAVRGPKHVVKTGATPVLTGKQWRTLLEAIPEMTLRDLLDRTLIATLTYSFARIGVALKMKVEDLRPRGASWAIRLHEKGGKPHTMPCHHALAEAPHAYINAAGIAADRKGWLFRTARGHNRKVLSENPMTQPDAWRMIRRRGVAAGIAEAIGCHTFRATGITAYLSNGGVLEHAQEMAAHESPRTTELYDRTKERLTQDEVERIRL